MNDLPLIVGTAGHVDHGKTTLIQALTGVDTDRLVEEKRRGMTIDLGFAPFTLPNGQLAGVVDVPGHEKFLKNMLAGAGGIDLVLLVVAADDGVMSQTREHLDILSLLHIPRGLVVLTKTDLVDPELLELAIEDVREALDGTFLADAPILPVAAATGVGMDALKAAIAEAAASTPQRDASRSPRLAVDRVFVKQGFGTVVTGTLLAGTLHEGDAVVIEPAGLASRVRGLQVHGGKRAEARAGQRVAVNLVGIEKAELTRGNWLLAPKAGEPSLLLDVSIEVLPEAKPLAHRTRIRLHHGTAELLGRVVLLDRDEIAPGETAPAQLVLEKPAVAEYGDRFVLRRYSPSDVVGGGKVLHPAPAKHKRNQAGTLEALAALAEGDPLTAMEKSLRQAGGTPVPESTLLGFVPASRQEEARAWLGAHAFPVAGGYLHREGTEALASELKAALSKFHQAMAWRVGLSKDELAQRTKKPVPLVGRVLQSLVETGALVAVGRFYALPGHAPALPADLAKARQQIEARLEAAPLADIDDFAEAGAGDRLAPLLEDLVEQGLLIRISGGVYASRARLEQLKDKLRAHFAKEPEITASQAREILETNRKYIIPFLEYLDTQGFTKRHGDVRVLVARTPVA
ncbi:MAG: selenocysteine-specific translation elongation factor [Candidatus Sericytochromatia bacterium]